MPIEVATEIRVLDQEEFHALDRRLMGIVFDVHNEFGRFFDEVLYKREIAARWLNAGLGTTELEVRVAVTHESFRKDCWMDLLFNHGLMLEAKVAEKLAPSHRMQGLNYPCDSGARRLGEQSVHLLTDDTAFAFTAVTAEHGSMAEHQLRFLKHTPLRCIQWINFNRHRIEFTTLAR